MPHVKITELLAEVDQWTNLGDQFLHLRTQVPPKNRQALLTAVLADGINLGLTRMSGLSRDDLAAIVLDRRLACARGVLCAGLGRSDRCPTSTAPGGSL